MVGAPSRPDAVAPHTCSRVPGPRSYAANSRPWIGRRRRFISRIDGTTVIIGAPMTNRRRHAPRTRSCVRAVWVQQYKMTATDAQWGPVRQCRGRRRQQGRDWGIEEDGKGTDAGAAYIFERSGIVWSQKDQMRASTVPGDAMGSAVCRSRVLGRSRGWLRRQPDRKATFHQEADRAGPQSTTGSGRRSSGPRRGAKDGFGSGVDIEGDRVE